MVQSLKNTLDFHDVEKCGAGMRVDSTWLNTSLFCHHPDTLGQF